MRPVAGTAAKQLQLHVVSQPWILTLASTPPSPPTLPVLVLTQ